LTKEDDVGRELAAIALDPGGWIAWLLVGLIAGALAGRVMKGSGYGCLGNIAVGLVGSILGGLVGGYFFEGMAGFWGSILVSFVGACLFIAILRLISGRRAP
jgi:uncharacterized membrane protein YeaQ/YmgE (transglycosylase-associated protein family)